MVALNDNRIIADRTVQLASAAVRDSLVLSNTFSRMADTQFTGRPGDVVTMRVKKPLAARDYPLYNDRAQPIKMDFLEETLVHMPVNKSRLYSAVGLRDEVRDFDFQGNWSEIVVSQSDAIVNKVEQSALAQLKNAPIEYVKYVNATQTAIKNEIALNRDLFYNALVDARTALRKMGSPLAQQVTYALAGSEWASELRKNQRANLATGNNTPSAFADATIGTYAGITIVESMDLDPNELYLYTADAFLMWTAPVGIPAGAKAAAQTTSGNVGMTWIQDYDANYAVDRSIMWSYSAFGNAMDFIGVKDTQGGLAVSEDQFFIRGAKLILGSGTDITPGSGNGDTAGASPDSFLAKLYNNQRVEATVGAGVFADLTYQNIVDGKVSAGKAGELGTIDGIRTGKNTKAAATEPATDPKAGQ